MRPMYNSDKIFEYSQRIHASRNGTFFNKLVTDTANIFSSMVLFMLITQFNFIIYYVPVGNF